MTVCPPRPWTNGKAIERRECPECGYAQSRLIDFHDFHAVETRSVPPPSRVMAYAVVAGAIMSAGLASSAEGAVALLTSPSPQGFAHWGDDTLFAAPRGGRDGSERAPSGDDTSDGGDTCIHCGSYVSDDQINCACERGVSA